MNNNAEELYYFYKLLSNKLKDKDFVVDKSGVKLVEELFMTAILDPRELVISFNSRKTPEKYMNLEKEWYLSKDLSIDQVASVAIWKQVADRSDQINSNYGNLVFSKSNYNQYQHVLETLINHEQSRQAIIIYQRPSIHLEWNDLGGSDFICTLYQHFFIRNNKLHCITNQRSVDAIYGIFNDVPWFHYVYQRMLYDLQHYYPELTYGDSIYNANSFHVYERHFDLLEKIALEK